MLGRVAYRDDVKVLVDEQNNKHVEQLRQRQKSLWRSDCLQRNCETLGEPHDGRHIGNVPNDVQRPLGSGILQGARLDQACGAFLEEFGNVDLAVWFVEDLVENIRLLCVELGAEVGSVLEHRLAGCLCVHCGDCAIAPVALRHVRDLFVRRILVRRTDLEIVLIDDFIALEDASNSLWRIERQQNVWRCSTKGRGQTSEQQVREHAYQESVVSVTYSYFELDPLCY